MPNFWKAAIEGEEANTEILRLFYMIREAQEKISMRSHQVQAEMIHSDIPLDDDDEYFIKIIAPKTKHLDNYAKNLIEAPFEEEAGNKPRTNWLSTVIKIYSNKHDGFILLTSDSNKDTLFYKKNATNDLDGKLLLAQCPHHGAAGNFKNAFWKLINRAEKTPIVFSVGNNIYGHPAERVVSEFNKNNYEIFSTNEVGALSELKHSMVGKEASIHLSTFGEIAATSRIDKLNGDKVFEIDSTGEVVTI